MPTIAIDFDGVLSLYNGDPDAPPGPPVPDAREFVEKLLQQRLDVVIFSSRDKDTVAHGVARQLWPPLGMGELDGRKCRHTKCHIKNYEVVPILVSHS